MWSPCSPPTARVRTCATLTAGYAAAIEPTRPVPVCWSWQAACTLMSSSRSACSMQRCWLPLWLAALQCLRQVQPSVLDLHTASATPQRQPGSMQCVLCPGPQSAPLLPQLLPAGLQVTLSGVTTLLTLVLGAAAACWAAGDLLRRSLLAGSGAPGPCRSRASAVCGAGSHSAAGWCAWAAAARAAPERHLRGTPAEHLLRGLAAAAIIR